MPRNRTQTYKGKEIKMQKPGPIMSFFIVALILVSLACSSAQQMIQGTPTPTLTSTLTLTPTSTSTPTFTPTFTSTPNLTATQQVEAFLPLVQSYFDQGLIPTTDGIYRRLDDHVDSLAVENNYRWFKMGLDIRNFIIKSHITLTTADLSPKSGCGIAFRVLEDFANVVFLAQDGNAYYMTNNEVFYNQYYGKAANPAEFDIVFVAKENKLTLYVNEKEALTYETFLETYVGDIGLTVLSASDKGFGTRCEFKDNELWVIE
jgi:hypothetical protein